MNQARRIIERAKENWQGYRIVELVIDDGHYYLEDILKELEKDDLWRVVIAQEWDTPLYKTRLQISELNINWKVDKKVTFYDDYNEEIEGYLLVRYC